MAEFEILTISQAPPSADEFPDEWYRQSGGEHFWMQWRIESFQRQLSDIGCGGREGWCGLDIGSGHGVVQGQIEKITNWRVDCCDLNAPALAASAGGRGRTMFYDIFDERPELREAYDFLILFDVIEHIDDPAAFLKAALFHLKPGGYVFINVPALMLLYSEYDRIAGHVQRFNKPTLMSVIEQTGLKCVDLRYWGLLMIPVLSVRKMIMGKQMDAADAIRRGFKPSGRLADAVLRMLKAIESAVNPRPVVGTSLLAAAKKPLSPRPEVL